MKFAITTFEQLGLVSTLIGQPVPNPEIGRLRLRAWDELSSPDHRSVSRLAEQLAMGALTGSGGPSAYDWRDNETMRLIDINPDVLDWILTGLRQPKPGVWADTLTRLEGRLEALRDKKYQLPEGLG